MCAVYITSSAPTQRCVGPYFSVYLFASRFARMSIYIFTYIWFAVEWRVA